jgi:AcrR family transcriptional regulator
MAVEIPLVTRGKHDKDQRQRALIEAATRAFAEKGYEATTTREIAERACCSEGLIHRYFGGKRGLLLAILRDKCERAAGMVHAAVPASESLEDELTQFMLWTLDFMWEQRDFMRVTVEQSVIDAEIGRYIGRGLNAERVKVLEEKLKRHRDAGRVRRDVDLHALAEAIAGLSFASGFFSQAVFETDRDDVRRTAIESARIIARGIEAGGSARAGARRRP